MQVDICNILFVQLVIQTQCWKAGETACRDSLLALVPELAEADRV
jgi:hypothetical protein